MGVMRMFLLPAVVGVELELEGVASCSRLTFDLFGVGVTLPGEALRLAKEVPTTRLLLSPANPARDDR